MQMHDGANLSVDGEYPGANFDIWPRKPTDATQSHWPAADGPTRHLLREFPIVSAPRRQFTDLSHQILSRTYCIDPIGTRSDFDSCSGVFPPQSLLPSSFRQEVRINSEVPFLDHNLQFLQVWPWWIRYLLDAIMDGQ